MLNYYSKKKLRYRSMGSIGSQNYPWAPYSNNYRSSEDCSQQGFCSIYCPQFCYFFFPPPSSPPTPNDDSTPLSRPLVIAVIGVLATAFLLVGYYTLVTRCCNRRRRSRTNSSSSSTSTTTINHAAINDQARCRVGLEDRVIRAIAIRAYKKGEGAAECAVCLSEFREGEPLRVLPKCSHAFHLPCIDTWLLSHSTCPLCRAQVVVVGGSQRVDRAGDVVLEVADDDDDIDDHEEEEEEEGIAVINRLGRSVSLRIVGTTSSEEDCVRMMMMKRSVSTGGLTFDGSRAKDCFFSLPSS